VAHHAFSLEISAPYVPSIRRSPAYPFLLAVQHVASTSPDSNEYLTLAHNLVAHHAFSLETSAPYVPSIRRSPAYPFLLAVLEWIGLSAPVWIIALQAALDAAVTVIVLLLGQLVLPLRWALAGAAFYAVHPGAIYTTTTMLSEPLFTFLLSVAMALLILGLKSSRVLVTIVAGVAMGAAILCRPVVLPLPFVIFALLFFRRRDAYRGNVILFIAATVVTVAPWSIRTSAVSGHLVLVQAHSAVNYWAPTVLFLDQRNESAIWKYEEKLLQENLPPGNYTPEKAITSDRILQREAIANIRANPVGYLKSRARSYPYLFLSSFDNFSGVNNSFGTLWTQRAFLQLAAKALLLLLFSALPLLFGVVGFVLGRRDLTLALISSIWLYMLVIQIPLWIEYRFWVPVVPFLIISAMFGLHRTFTAFAKRRGETSPAVLATTE
jgi:4-amino-4-deoxy-L-arabinose transferase-like glycosyltransferase